MSDENVVLVEAYRAGNAPDAHMFSAALEEAGIKVRIDGESLQGGIGDLPAGWLTAPRLMVLETDLEAARRIIEAIESKQAATTREEEIEEEQDVDDSELGSECLSCGTFMRAELDRCPKCNWSFNDSQAATTAQGQ